MYKPISTNIIANQHEGFSFDMTQLDQNFTQYVLELEYLDEFWRMKILDRRYRSIMKRFVDRAKTSMTHPGMAKNVGVKKLKPRDSKRLSIMGGGVFTKSPLVNIFFHSSEDVRVIGGGRGDKLKAGYYPAWNKQNPRKRFIYHNEGEYHRTGKLALEKGVQRAIDSESLNVQKEALNMTTDQIIKEAEAIADKLEIKLR